MKKIKVLFVCLGNICRSPLAEAIFKHKIKEKGLDKFVEADSSGTSNYNIGDTPDRRTIANALMNGIQLQHSAKQLKAKDLEHYDFILAMDATNHQDILLLENAHHHKHKLKLMRDFDPISLGDVPDPYYGSERNFQEVFEILNRTMDGFVEHIEEELRVR